MSVALRRTTSHHRHDRSDRPRRVRHQARDAIAVAAVSAATSVGLAAGAGLLLAWLGRG